MGPFRGAAPTFLELRCDALQKNKRQRLSQLLSLA